MQEAERDDKPAATQYEIMRDAGFKHLQHADEDDKRATQRLRQKDLTRQSNRADAVANHAAENGILESIQCLNFMCHENLRVELGPLLNFIVGENGSGKSAVLTAITLCLGGKASSTNRGGSLKSFIKEGKEKSILIVKIKNMGRDSYQREIYGDSIIVERHFSRGGSSGFYIKSDTGRTISTKKRDVDEIVEYYCLQVDNPLNVLSQDNARQFLNAASAKQKYKFFVQGVQLQQLDDDYRVIEEYLNSNENKEGDLQNRLEAAQKEYEKAKRDWDLVQESGSMRQQQQLLRQKAAWSQVADKERELVAHDDQITEAGRLIAKAQTDVDNRAHALDRLEEQIAEAEQTKTNLDVEKAELDAKVKKANEDWDQGKRDLLKLNADERDVRSQLTSADRDVKDYEQRIREEEQRLQDLNGDAITRKNQELESARTRLHQIEEESKVAQQRVPELNKTKDKAVTELTTVGQLIAQKKGDITTAQKRIKELEQGQGSLYDAYETQMRQLLRMIEEDAGFERKPVGPIGAHIQVLEPMWSPMLERTFGESLNGFVVTSKRDQLRLSEMMRRLKMVRSPILIGNARPIDTSNSEPDKNFSTILRILKIDDPLIRNQLIINNRIEKTILVKTKAEADRIMLSSAPPRNVIACYHPLPAKGHGWTVRLTVNANGASSSPTRPPDAHQKPRLKSDSRQETSLYTDRLSQLQTELKDLQNQKIEQQRASEHCDREILRIKKLVEEKVRRRRQIEADVNQIESDLDSFEGVDGRLEGLRADLVRAQESVNVYGDQYGTIGLRKSEQNQLCEQLHKTHKNEEAQHAKFMQQVAKAEDKVKRGNDMRLIAVQAKNEAHDSLQMAENAKRRLEVKQERLRETVTEWTEAATKVCPRVHIGENETYESIEKKLDSLDRTLKERERRRGMTDDQVIQRAGQTKEAYNSLRKAYDQVCKENRALKQTLNKRLKKWRSFQRYISSNSRANFMYLLSERDFRGKLVIDHEKHTLDVQVEPDKTRKNAAARNTKTLSGGEKSFSSICLLLAIWEAMGSPLRCLDEFDVFMDNVNRAISTNMLVSHIPLLIRESILIQRQVSAARNSVGRQYILITPNAIEGRAKLDKDVKITRYTTLLHRGRMSEVLY